MTDNLPPLPSHPEHGRVWTEAEQRAIRAYAAQCVRDERERHADALRCALLDARDCRTCRNFTTRSGGCVSVLRCIDGSGYQRQGRFQYWEAAPLDPAPF